MSYIFLIRGGASDDTIIWLAVIVLAGLLLGGKWLANRLTYWVHSRRVQHLWPFK